MHEIDVFGSSPRGASCLEALTHLSAIGGKLNLVTIQELEPYLEQKEFLALAETMKPVDPPRPAGDSLHTLQDADLWNEGIANDRKTGDLYAGSIKHGKIVRLRGSVQEDFGTTGQDDPPASVVVEIVFEKEKDN